MDARLYILTRTDLASMNPGKAMAHAAHAAQVATHAARALREVRHLPELYEAYEEWEGSTPQGFGTTIVLAVDSEYEMNRIVDEANNAGFINGIVHDPTYPVRDGKVTHLIPMDTGAYIFVPDPSKMFFSLTQLPLAD